MTGINLTPVLSIALITLLFFVISVPFMRERGFDFWIPDEHPDCNPFVIMVDSRNRIFVDDNFRFRAIELRAVRNTVAHMLAELPTCSVLVLAHRESDMGIVLRIFDEAKQARHRPPVSVQIATAD